MVATAADAQAGDKNPSASAYPNRPVRFLVPFTPGGSADIFSRAIGQKLSERLGQQVVIDNRAGSNGIIGSEIAAKAPPDGYTLTTCTTGSFGINPGLYKKLPYDPVSDFAPITMIAAAPYVLVMSPSVPAKTVQDLITYAKARPGQLNYASTGAGSVGHLGIELFAIKAGIKIVHVPYKGMGPALVDVFSSQVQLFMAGIVSVQSHVKSGRLRALAITSKKHSPLMPEVPTVAESVIPNFDVLGWYGVFAPARTPRPIVTRLHDEIVKILRTPEFNERLSAEGAELGGNSPEEFGAYIKSEIAKWTDIIRLSGTTPE
jgi:tripartite-type tricarboxylate transporter receptor subunit TctC